LDRPGYERRARARLSRIPGLPDVPNIPAMPSMPGLPSLPGRRSSSPRLPLSTDMHNHRMMRGDSIAMGAISAVSPFLAVIVRLGGSAFDVSLLTAIPAVGGFLLAIPVGQFLQGKARIVPWYSGSRMVAQMSYAVAALVVLVAPAEFAVPGVLVVLAIAAIPSTVGMVAFPIVMDGVAARAAATNDGPPLGDHGRHDGHHRCARRPDPRAAPLPRQLPDRVRRVLLAGLVSYHYSHRFRVLDAAPRRRRQRVAGSTGPAR
jgi:hypothetical protein